VLQGVRSYVWSIFTLASLACSAGVSAEPKPMPIFDSHIHYNRAAWRVFDPPYVLELLQRADVVGGLVGSWPDEGTIKLHSAFPDRFVAELCPYQELDDRENWSKKPGLLEFLAERIATGRYKGLGELHIMKRDDADWDVIAKVVGLAGQHGLFLHIHSGAEVVGRLFAIAPDVRILWAHAGFYENAATISAMLDKYSNLTAELSLRAPNIMPAAAEDIGADWLALFERHSDRIVVGSDTYINLAWVEYDEIMDAHRNWLSRLPQHIAEKIAWRNAKTYFGLPEALFQTSRRDP
jgi:hypothetical protein